MKLDTYLKERGQSQADFGASLTPPVTQALVSQWILGKTAVSLHYSLEIFRKTGGAVTAEDCLEMLQREARTRSKRLEAAHA